MELRGREAKRGLPKPVIPAPYNEQQPAGCCSNLSAAWSYVASRSVIRMIATVVPAFVAPSVVVPLAQVQT